MSSFFNYALLTILATLIAFFSRSSSSSSATSSSPPAMVSYMTPLAPVKAIRRRQPKRVVSKVAGPCMTAEVPFFVSNASDAFSKLSLDDQVPNVNDLTDSFAKLSNKEWIPYSDKPLRKPSPEVDDLASSFAAFSTNDRPLEKSAPIVNELVSSFGSLSTFDKPCEKSTPGMDSVIDSFGKLWDKERRLRSERTLPKPSPEVDDLAACFGNLSCTELRLRSCFKAPGRRHNVAKSVSFVTYPDREDVDVCELRFFELEEGETLSHRVSRSSRHLPHVHGEKFIGVTSTGTTQLVKATGFFRSPTKSSNLLLPWIWIRCVLSTIVKNISRNGSTITTLGVLLGGSCRAFVWSGSRVPPPPPPPIPKKLNINSSYTEPVLKVRRSKVEIPKKHSIDTSTPRTQRQGQNEEALKSRRRMTSTARTQSQGPKKHDRILKKHHADTSYAEPRLKQEEAEHRKLIRRAKIEIPKKYDHDTEQQGEARRARSGGTREVISHRSPPSISFRQRAKVDGVVLRETSTPPSGGPGR
ncbi:uncharacterized protein LY89DRAFT_772116 [Mollisia scopiformis]|uniref:Uncharacterized protein n=1 Tax=Mollisia scopiformis TaxID=149040 RepID=A0A194XHP1_MOLSC|nr:uncharacterized protein LY89DRAFT_772116 [Mollisia scopiformis]KUJ19649.1 hypothetical protein LY89DRAFT_772116 [Mollisia scopiformis]